MAAFRISVSGINNNVIPKLQEGNKVITKVLGYFEELDIPSDFSYGSELRGYSSRTKDLYTKILTSVEKIKQTVKDYESVERQNKEILSNEFKSIQAMNLSVNYTATGASIAINTTVNSENKTLGSVVSNSILEIGNSVINGLEKCGAVVAEKCEWLYTNIISPVFAFVGKTACSVVNVAISLIKGIASLAEHLVDAVTIISTAAGSIVTGAIDLVQMSGSQIYKTITGTELEWESKTKKMWQGTMSFVADKHVENAFKDFYEKNSIGQFLDANAFALFKSDGILSNVVSGISEVVGIVALTVLTLGIGTAAGIGAAGASAASGVVGTAIATINGFGSYTAEKWNELKESYENKLQQMYEAGEITLDRMNDLKDEWTDMKNCLSGLKFGAMNGLWEGVQWGAGAYLGANKISTEIPELLNSAINIFADTAFNAMDTFVRAGTSALTTEGLSIEEAFEQYGGMTAVFTNVVIGLVGSVGGEVFEYHNLTNKKTVEDLHNITKRFVKDYNLSDIQAKQLLEIIEVYGEKKSNVYISMFVDGNEKFYLPYSAEYTNAVNSGIKLKKTGTQEYFKIKAEIMDKYGLSSKEAGALIELFQFEMNKQQENSIISKTTAKKAEKVNNLNATPIEAIGVNNKPVLEDGIGIKQENDINCSVKKFDGEFMAFSKEKMTSIREMGEYFGDARKKCKLLFSFRFYS